MAASRVPAETSRMASSIVALKERAVDAEGREGRSGPAPDSVGAIRQTLSKALRNWSVEGPELAYAMDRGVSFIGGENVLCYTTDCATHQP